MATVSQLPGSLNVALVRGDEFSTTVDVKLELSGYQFDAEVFSLLTGDQLQVPTVVYVGPALNSLGNPVAGWSRLSVAMSETQTAAMATGTYGFRIAWTAPGDAKRTALAGVCEVRA